MAISRVIGWYGIVEIIASWMVRASFGYGKRLKAGAGGMQVRDGCGGILDKRSTRRKKQFYFVTKEVNNT